MSTTTRTVTSAPAVSMSLRKGVYVSRTADGGTCLMAWPHTLSVGALTDSAHELLRTLAAGDVPLDALPSDDESVSGQVLELLRSEGWIGRTIRSRVDDRCFQVRPFRPPVGADEDAAARLSRFAIVRREAEGYLLESPLASAEIVLSDMALLDEALTPEEDTERSPTSAMLRRELAWQGFTAAPGGPEDTTFALRQWSPHELLFHDRSRVGYRGYVGDGFGGTWWAQEEFDCPPAQPEPYDGVQVDLPEPDAEHGCQDDRTYFEVAEQRRSRRDHDQDRPITRDELAELLYRTMRVRRTHAEGGVELVSGPRPSGGSVYELEAYVVVTRCSGVSPGLYHYDAHHHRLTSVRAVSHQSVRRMLRVASHGSTSDIPPQALIVISARVGRVMWKYEGMALAIIMKNTGVLYHALACTSEALGLAGCPLGTDDAVAFTEATGRNPLEECSVGQFAVGARVDKEVIG